MEPIAILFGWTLVIVFLAFIACLFEDLESDVGSQSNPNSQVQLAPQVGRVHRFFNKAISGEPPAYAMYCTIAGVIAWVLLENGLHPFFAIPIGVLVGEVTHLVFSVTGHFGRIAGSKRFEQPIYLDVVYGHLLPIATHGFMAVLCIVSIAYIQSNIGTLSGIQGLDHPFALPLLAFVWGITVGAIGSSTGDIHYGTEREFQDRAFGEGRRVTFHGKITRYAECGIRTQKDIVSFCAKFGGPITGLTFGLIILFENWRLLVAMMLSGFLPEVAMEAGDLTAIYSIIIGALIGIAFLIGNVAIVRWARKRYGPFVGD